MFVAIHYIKWNQGGILSINPPRHTHTHRHTPTHTSSSSYYHPAFFVYVVMYIYIIFFLGAEGIIIGALGADWALRLASERPADYVRLRAETKPAQPLNFTAFGSYSRSSAHFQTRCLPTSLRERERERERERGRVCVAGRRRRSSSRRRRKKNNTFLRLLRNLTAEHRFHL